MGGGTCGRPFAHGSWKTGILASSQLGAVLAGTFGKGLCKVSWHCANTQPHVSTAVRRHWLRDKKVYLHNRCNNPARNVCGSLKRLIVELFTLLLRRSTLHFRDCIAAKHSANGIHVAG
jgi:hypothetical protein